ncbi:uncharacterized protein Z520_05982 [Fonsecaea multimorphosa CBS 102226]|uniref:Uncharacterized protein n=1 Tax=Fonsecaea multimorphosa CBS 102226 TaxID=1442371 RepID=A0A0D2INS3_9EURO|nr:uncharacterized protein Z520_05982 [Fonsecaea multimorphosa CBS 102226]KIX98681.1 hypothetical protein Z520_05982 [Fonsecaea multimorphosa CBS 102226]OAL24866.1 hypothetical protein AYO22_05655 [Fonsecaea multimorphosa]
MSSTTPSPSAPPDANDIALTAPPDNSDTALTAPPNKDDTLPSAPSDKDTAPPGPPDNLDNVISAPSANDTAPPAPSENNETALSAPLDNQDTTLSAPSAPFISLKYAPGNKCICAKQGICELATSLCPQHGYHDNKSKVTKRKSSCIAGESHETAKDGKDRRDRKPRDRVRRRRNTAEPQPRRSRNPFYPRHSLPTSNAERTAVGAFAAELRLMNDTLRQVLTGRSASDDYIRSFQFSERPPLTQIDFLDWPLEARKIIYRFLLVPAKRAIIFPGKDSNHTFSQLNPDLNARILRTNSQVYSEARNILYSENSFTAAEPSDFFYPNGVQGLRASTANKIKHISFLRKASGPKLCDIDSKVLSTSILSLIFQCPAFLSLDTLTIRFEVLRPVTVNMHNLQVQYANNGIDCDIRSVYNKTEVVMTAAAMVAYKTLRRRSPFQGLKEVENRFVSVFEPNRDRCIRHVTEICLFRTSEPVMEYQAQSQMLREAILDMLFEEKERGVQGAEERFRDFVRRYPE